MFVLSPIPCASASLKPLNKKTRKGHDMRLAHLVPLLALLLAPLAHGQTRWGEAQIALHGGAGNIKLDDYDHLYDTNGTLAFGISGEYVSTFHVLLEIGWQVHNQDADLAGLES